MSAATPLRDRLRSNSTNDPDAEWRSPTTTPLRIAKKESPQRGIPLARRQSNSYKHLKTNNLVSKSPFRSQIPTPLRPSGIAPSPRRVSGEKRSRPVSMHEQAENEHPLGFKRRQSRAFQGLLEKEPVTKSPFKLSPGDEGYEEPPPPPPPSVVPRKVRKKAPVYEESDHLLPPPPPPKHSLSPRASPRPAVSPARPSLVSKRLHGPRESGMFGRKARRKTVTFDERCDVMEFSAEEEMEGEENQGDWTTDTDDEDDVLTHEHERQHTHEGNDSYDSSQTGDDSITGLVDSMLQDTEPLTPTHDQGFPDDLETEDGVPYGRSHHADRAVAIHTMQRAELEEDPEDTLSPLTARSLVSTPTHSRDTPPLGPLSPGSQIPLGRSTHSERQRAHKEEERAEVDEDVQMLPPSPSPAKRTSVLPIVHANRDSLIPKFDLGVSSGDRSGLSDDMTEMDPFGASTVLDDLPHDEQSFMSAQLIDQFREPEDLDPANLSVGNSEVSLSGIEMGSRESTEERHLPHATSTPPTSPPFRSNSNYPRKAGSTQSLENLIDLDSPPPFGSLRTNSPRVGSPALGQSPRSGSPLIPNRTASPLLAGLAKSASQTSLHSPNGSLSGHSPRISREDVHRRLLKKRSIDSPLRESLEPTHRRSSTDPGEEPRGSTSRALPTPLSRKNPTYDGVLSMDPEPQAIDPPRPTLGPRSRSIDGDMLQSIADKTFEGLNVDFSTGFDVGMDIGGGLGMSLGETPLGDMRSALDRLMEDVAGEAGAGPSELSGMRLKIEAVTAGVQAGQYQLPTDSEDPDATQEQSREVDIEMAPDAFSPRVPEPLRPTSPSVAPPPVKDARRTREELILKKKREARQREEDEDMGLRTPPRALGIGRPSRRRSRSTGDAENIGRRSGNRPSGSNDGGLLDELPVEEDPLADEIDRELRKMGSPSQKSKYHVRERSETIYASSGHNAAGDLDSGRAWRPVRRPSDMNEYARQIKELRARGGTARGKVFLKILGVRNLIVPFPREPTHISCTLNNGIHFVETPVSLLGPDCQLGSEFELIETNKLEITLTLKIRRDPHIVAQFKANAPPAPVTPTISQPPPPESKGGGMRGFFFGSPKKPSKIPAPAPRATPPPAPHRLHENLARYLLTNGSLARAFIQFKDVMGHCDSRLFETAFPLIGQKLEAGGSTRSMQVGELVLQIFRLPPVPGLAPEDLPQSLEECHRGLRNVNWHQMSYMEGTLTQSGGDCVTRRRRHFRIVGANLIAYNDVTKRAMATIDLKKAIGVEDDELTRNSLLSPGSGATNRYSDDYEYPFPVERSFRLLFPNDEEIIFSADSEDEKAKWLEVLKALVGRIPPRPLWAEMVLERQQELGKQPGSAAPRTNGYVS
ncbi:Bud site selection protein bud4 [Steccherinum ochraceum]|uniref:Bud site selection protein bud4 n=1 Tax=Steccherinum ochraceum TaxID=92696 RepID=A0A4R0RAD7_9APHY|nr:Bud site selection protein bud4 [Steccherinum ochraceum]